MNSKIESALLIVICVLASAITSYATTIAVRSNQQANSSANNNQQTIPQNTAQPSSQNNNQTSAGKIYPSHNERLDVSLDNSYVSVTSAVAIRDLTISYHFTSLNGSVYTIDEHYGDYHPTWSPNHLIQLGEVQFQYYQIPPFIMKACSSTKPVYDSSGEPAGTTWDVHPKLTVTVYGYAFG
jgi:hypothetical protein